MATPYTTEAEANAYFLGVGAPAAWTAATTAQRTVALQNAAEWLDRTYGPRWVGDRIERSQERDWPRDNAVDRNGFEIANTGTPSEVKDAANEVAGRYLADPTLTDGDVTERGIQSIRAKADTVEDEVHYTGSKPEQQKAFPKVEQMLYNVLEAGTGAGVGVVSLG